MAITTNLAGVARVAFETKGMGEFNRDVDTIERNYKHATGEMSDAAIKLELANERLRRSLAKGPSAAQSQARALLSVRSAERELAAETARTTAVTETQTRRFGRLRSSAATLAGTTGFGGLRTSVAGVAGGLLAGGGLLYAFRSAISAAEESQTVLGQTRLAVERAGASWDAYAGRIDASTAALSRLGFDDEELSKTFSTFVIATKNVTEALRLNAIATDVARARYLDLKAAADIVLKASLGQAGALRRIGIDARNGASGVELLTQLTESYGGAAQRASHDASTATQRLNVALGNLKETAGTVALPYVSDLATALAIAADNANRLALNVDKLGEKSGISLGGLGGLFKMFGGPLALPLRGKGVVENLREGDFLGAAKEGLFGLTDVDRKPAPSAGLASRPDEGTRGPAPTTRARRPTPRRGPLTNLPRALSDALNAAQLTTTTADDLRVARQAEAFWRTQLNRAKKGTETRSTILGQLVAAHHAVEGIEAQLGTEQDRHDTAVTSQREKTLRQHEAALERRKSTEKASADREARIQKAIADQAHENAERINKALKDAKTGRELLTGQGATATGEKGLTMADIRRVQFEFLQGLKGMTNESGSNAYLSQLQSHAFLQTHVLRNIDRGLRDLTRGVQHPGAKYARLELMEPFGGVGSV